VVLEDEEVEDLEGVEVHIRGNAVLVEAHIRRFQRGNFFKISNKIRVFSKHSLGHEARKGGRIKTRHRGSAGGMNFETTKFSIQYGDCKGGSTLPSANYMMATPSSGATGLIGFVVAPYSVGSEVASVAQYYEKYRIKNLWLSYKMGNNSLQNGDLIMVIEGDPVTAVLGFIDPVSNTFTMDRLAQAVCKVEGSIQANHVVKWENKDKSWKFTNPTTSEDLRLYLSACVLSLSNIGVTSPTPQAVMGKYLLGGTFEFQGKGPPTVLPTPQMSDVELRAWAERMAGNQRMSFEELAVLVEKEKYMKRGLRYIAEKAMDEKDPVDQPDPEKWSLGEFMKYCHEVKDGTVSDYFGSKHRFDEKSQLQMSTRSESKKVGYKNDLSLPNDKDTIRFNKDNPMKFGEYKSTVSGDRVGDDYREQQRHNYECRDLKTGNIPIERPKPMSWYCDETDTPYSTDMEDDCDDAFLHMADDTIAMYENLVKNGQKKQYLGKMKAMMIRLHKKGLDYTHNKCYKEFRWCKNCFRNLIMIDTWYHLPRKRKPTYVDNDDFYKCEVSGLLYKLEKYTPPMGLNDGPVPTVSIAATPATYSQLISGTLSATITSPITVSTITGPVKICDGSNTAQMLGVDSSNRIKVTADSNSMGVSASIGSIAGGLAVPVTLGTGVGPLPVSIRDVGVTTSSMYVSAQGVARIGLGKREDGSGERVIDSFGATRVNVAIPNSATFIGTDPDGGLTVSPTAYDTGGGLYRTMQADGSGNLKCLTGITGTISASITSGTAPLAVTAVTSDGSASQFPLTRVGTDGLEYLPVGVLDAGTWGATVMTTTHAQGTQATTMGCLVGHQLVRSVDSAYVVLKAGRGGGTDPNQTSKMYSEVGQPGPLYSASSCVGNVQITATTSAPEETGCKSSLSTDGMGSDTIVSAVGKRIVKDQKEQKERLDYVMVRKLPLKSEEEKAMYSVKESIKKIEEKDDKKNVVKL